MINNGKTVFFAVLLIFVFQSAITQPLGGKIKIYFTNPVNVSVSNGNDAVYLNNSMDDTLVAYISRAKYTLDIAEYNYQQSSTNMADIAAAVNSAYSRGVIVRWIYDESSSNTGLSGLNAGIHTLASPPNSGIYGIMHNKFMIIDANSADNNDPLVWTGSTNWTKTHFNSNVNNTVIIQDKLLALAYTDEFNEMWGSTSTTPDTANSKFGPDKTDPLSTHIFTIGGKFVELYFSPTDQVNSHVLNSIQTAGTDLYFSMLTFSISDDADSLIGKNNNGVFVAGIIDQSSQIYTPYSLLSASLGSYFKVYSQITSVYHNKFAIVDPSDPASDPAVLTGSFNWTTSAETQNDENMLIIHDADVANIFYQSFYQNFEDLGGSLPIITDVKNKHEIFNDFYFYPNPFVDGTNMVVNIPAQINIEKATLIFYDMLGNKIHEIDNITSHQISVGNDMWDKGVYCCMLYNNNEFVKMIKLVR